MSNKTRSKPHHLCVYLLLVLLLTSAVGKVNAVPETNNKTCPNEELLKAGYTKAASTSCQTNIRSEFVDWEEGGRSANVSFTRDDQDVFFAAIVTAINQAIAAGDDGFPPFVVDKMSLDTNRSKTPEITLLDDGRRLQDIAADGHFEELSISLFRYRVGSACRFCKPELTDARAIRILQEPNMDTDTITTTDDGYDFFDDAFFDDDIAYQDDDQFYVDDDTVMFQDEGEFILVSDRIVAILEDTGRIFYQNITCFSITCDGSEYVDITGNCDEFFEEPATTEAPTQAPATTAGAWCFSGDSQVTTQNGGVVNMKDLRLGDMVHVGNDEYEPIYSFGHYAPEVKGGAPEMLQIATTKTTKKQPPLQLSRDHMVAQPDGRFVPAGQLKQGDVLLTMDGTNAGQHTTISITSIDTIRLPKGAGVFAPFTPSGKIVVNGILASSFVSLTGTETLDILGTQTRVSHQWLAWAWERPHWWYCASTFTASCYAETYTNEGISTWVALPRNVAVWMLLGRQEEGSSVVAILMNKCYNWVALLTTVALLMYQRMHASRKQVRSR